MERLWQWFLNQRQWLIVCSHQGKPEIVGEHWFKFMAEWSERDLQSMKPLTKSQHPDYQMIHRKDWPDFEKQHARNRRG